VPDKSIVMELSAVDPKFVIRPEVRIVAGWYTWLCADMVGSMLLGQAGYNGLTQCLNIDLVKTYRTPILVGKGVVVSIVDNVWTIDIELSNSSGTVVSTATGAFKGFKRELI
jgi:acyl-coenzyme A thioesterase PaaI-like protein